MRSESFRMVGIVGSQHYPLLHLVRRFVARDLPHDWSIMIVSGGAIGVDTVAVEAAKSSNIPYTVFPFRRSLGRSGGMVRNSVLVNFCHDIYAFWDMVSPGTLDTISKAKKAGKLRKVFGPTGLEIDV